MCEKCRDHREIYLKVDILLLADVFVNTSGKHVLIHMKSIL